MNPPVTVFFCLLFLCLFSSCGHRILVGERGAGALAPSSRQAAVPLSPLSPREEVEKQLQDMFAQVDQRGEAFRGHLVNKLFFKASQSSWEEEYEFSTLFYEYLLKLSPDDPYLVLKYATDMIRLGKQAVVLPMLEKNYSRYVGVYKEEYALLLGSVYQSYKKTKLAVKVYEDILQANGGHVEACLFLTKVYFQDLEDAKSAFRIMRQCQSNDPREAVFPYYHGKLLISQGRLQQAEQFFRKSLQIESSFYQSTLALGVLLEKRGAVSQAIQVYRELLEFWPNNRVILSRMVRTLFSLEKYDEVLNYAQRLIYLDPSDLNLKVRLSLLHLGKKDYDKTIELLQSVYKEVPTSDKVIFYLGTAHHKNRQYKKAMSFFERIPPSSPLYLEGSLQVAKVLSHLAMESRTDGDEERLFDFIAERSKNNQKLELALQVLKGKYYELSGRINEGIEVIERVAFWPNFTDSQRYYLAMLQDKVKNYDRSLILLEEILQNDPQNAHAWNFIGYTYLERNEGKRDLERAHEYISQAVALDPNNGYIRDSLGWYYYRAGKLSFALKQLKLAHRLVQNSSVITKHLALVYQALSRYDLAESFFLKALNLAQGDHEREEVQKFISQIQTIRKNRGRYPASSTPHNASRHRAPPSP